MEGTNIPDELTYHEPSPRSNTERRGTLFMTARVVSTIFTPFMVPFIAFSCSSFHLPAHHAPAIQTDGSGAGLLFYHSAPDAGHLSFQKINGWGIHGLSNRKQRFVPYGLTLLSYLGCYLTMYRIHLPRYMCGIILATMICMIICSLINFRLKISTHMASSGMMVGGLLSYSFISSLIP